MNIAIWHISKKQRSRPIQPKWQPSLPRTYFLISRSLFLKWFCTAVRPSRTNTAIILGFVFPPVFFATDHFASCTFAWKLLFSNYITGSTFNDYFLILAISPSVLWHCWLGVRNSIRSIKNWVTRCWCGYLSVWTLERCTNDLHMVMSLPPYHLLLH